MSLSVRPLDLSSDAELLLTQTLYEEAERATDPSADLYTYEEYVSVLRSPSAERLWEAFVAVDSSGVVGTSLLSLGLSANRHLAEARIWVSPRHQGRGAGSALAAHAEEWTLAHGASTVTSTVYISSAPGQRSLAFARRHGYDVVVVEEERRLPLPTPPGALAALAAEVAPRHTAYDVRVVTGPVPAELAQGLCDVGNRLALDAPHGDMDIQEAEQRTPADLAQQDAEMLANGTVRHTGYAVARDTGEVVAVCTLVAPPGVTYLRQWGTVVHPDHRGHRLGLAVKVATYAAAEAAHPHATHVVTWNAGDNQHMVAVNAAMGFVLQGSSATVQKRLRPTPARH